MQRIQIIGSSGAGKSTVGQLLATRLGLPLVELDDLWWGADWQEVGDAELARRIEPVAAQDRWVIVGDYAAATGAPLWPRLTHLVVLDLPYPLLLWRCLRRALRRTLERAGGPGARRRALRRLFHRDGVLRHLMRTWHERHRRYGRLADDPALAHADVVHLTDQRALDAWLARQAPTLAARAA